MKKITIVTGGNSGLGLSISKELVKKGYNVCIVGRNKNKLDNAKNELISINNNVDLLSYDLNISDESKVIDLYNSLNEYTIESLYNVAGVGVFGKPNGNTKEKINMVLEASLIGLILMTTYALKSMEIDGGKIINVMSTAAIRPKGKESIYCAAKYGAKGYTDSLKEFYKGSNINIVGVYPGGLNTPFWDNKYSLPVDKTKFMSPDEVAKQIVECTTNTDNILVSDIVIDRK